MAPTLALGPPPKAPNPLAAALAKVTDPLQLAALLWPKVQFYKEQRELIYSLRESVETYCVAGNMLGKDFVTGFIALSAFLKPDLYFSREEVAVAEAQRHGNNPFPHSRRILTTSVKDDHLRVLWAEIGRFISSASIPLLSSQGGSLTVNHHEVRFAWEREAKNPMNYLLGCVSEKGEGLSGHHAAYTLLIGDEASGIDDLVYSAGQGWAKRFLFIGNPNPSNGFFYKGVKGGNLLKGASA